MKLSSVKFRPSPDSREEKGRRQPTGMRDERSIFQTCLFISLFPQKKNLTSEGPSIPIPGSKDYDGYNLLVVITMGERSSRAKITPSP